MKIKQKQQITVKSNRMQQKRAEWIEESITDHKNAENSRSEHNKADESRREQKAAEQSREDEIRV